MRSITLAQFDAERSERSKDPTGGKLELYRLEDRNEYVGNLPIVLVIPSPNPHCEPFLVHRLRDEDAVRELIDSLSAVLDRA